MNLPHFSIVIPTLNEADNIGPTLRAAKTAFGPAAEYLIVDGGSTDLTVQLAIAEGARAIHGPRGRGAQLQAGLQESLGVVVVFLHADTLLPQDAAAKIDAVLADTSVVGGSFRLRFDNRDGALPFPLRWLAPGINLRSRLFSTATGDQAIFARRAILESIGGVQPVPLFEDVRLYRTLRRTGRVLLLSSAVSTSARRWRKSGPIRLILLHLVLRALHAAGVPPARLVKLYR